MSVSKSHCHTYCTIKGLKKVLYGFTEWVLSYIFIITQKNNLNHQAYFIRGPIQKLRDFENQIFVLIHNNYLIYEKTVFIFNYNPNY